MNFIKTKIIAGCLLLAIVGIVFFSQDTSTKYDRFVLFFKNSITKEIETEVRFVPKQAIKSLEEAFVEELMLGPVNHEQYSFMPTGSFVNACFLKKNILYIDLPKSFLKIINLDMSSDVISFLLEKNIFTNFKTLDSVFISVEGEKRYEFSKK